MTAPANKTIGDLNGKWYLNKTLSDPVEPALALQGVSWLVRKAIGAAGITLHVRQYLSKSEAGAEVPHVDIEQVATGGVRGTTENRTADFVFREHSDWLFGRVRGRCKFASASEVAAFLAGGEGDDEGGAVAKGWVRDDGFLLDGWLLGDAEAAGAFGAAGRPLFLNHVENLDAAGGWTATQVWGFQDLGGGDRRYARNVVTAKDGEFVALRMVYDWVPE